MRLRHGLACMFLGGSLLLSTSCNNEKPAASSDTSLGDSQELQNQIKGLRADNDRLGQENDRLKKQVSMLEGRLTNGQGSVAVGNKRERNKPANTGNTDRAGEAAPTPREKEALKESVSGGGGFK